MLTVTGMPAVIGCKSCSAIERRTASGTAVGRSLVGAGQDQQELLAAEAGRDAARNRGRQPAEYLTNGAQDVVADLVRAQVVDTLEQVEVDHRDGERGPAVTHSHEGQAQLLVDVTAVVQASERVPLGQVAVARAFPPRLRRLEGGLKDPAAGLARARAARLGPGVA